MPHILIVEDEAAIADTLIFALQGEGFTTTWLSLGAAALEHQRQTPADLIILDIGLPDISGFETCKQLRRFSEVPVMFLSARDGEIDRVVGLEIGADDYVVKPFGFRELVARIRAVLRRASGEASSAPSPRIEVGDLVVDRRTRTVTYRDASVALSPKEFDLLVSLGEDPGAVRSREQLMHDVWDEHWWGSTKTLDVHIASLRKKLDPDLIETVRSVGYRLHVDDA